ncbi:AraC family transcriptional regulator [Paenibacillus sp. GXUN7292]|uniref:AraC family transcriptional regulator n=1 Tax=Paenibacillus sp. GXUN7292 TaxID=3422499 RepID=UPI003D7C815D
MKWRMDFKNRYGTKVFITFSLILSLVVILLSVTVYAIYAKDRTDAIVDANLRTLSMTSFSADFMHANALELLVTQFNDPKKQMLMYGDKLDALTLKEERDKLLEQVVANQFVASIHVYNQKQDRIISTSWQSISTRSNFYDQELMEMLRAPIERSVPIARKIPMTKANEREDVYTYVLYDYYNPDYGIDGAVILNIKSSYLGNLVHAFEEEQKSNELRTVLIVDQNGWMVSPSIMKGDQYTDVLTQSVVAKVMSIDSRSGHFIYPYEGKSYIVTHVNSSLLGWKFIDIQDYNEQILVINQLRGYTVGFALFFLLIGLLASFIVSNKLTGPLKELLRKIKGTSSSLSLLPEPVSEWKAIEMVLNKTLPYYQQAKLLRKNELLKSILHSENETVLQAQLAKHHMLDVDFDKPYQIILLEIDQFSSFSGRYSTSDQELLRYALRKVVAEQLDRYGIKGEVINFSERKQVILLNWPQTIKADNTIDDIKSLSQSMQEWIFANLNLSLTITVSDVVEGQAPIDAFNDAAYLSQYRYLVGHRALISRQTVNSLKQEEVYKIPAAMEAALSDAILAGKYEESVKKLMLIMHTLQDYRYEIIVSNVRYLLFFLYNISQVTPSHNQPNSFDLNAYNQVLEGLETLPEAESFFQEILYQVTQSVKEHRENRSAVIAKHIAAHIEKNYSDPNLCMDTIADHLNFSKVYISKVFRETYAKTIGDYILEYRIQKVMEGLTQREISIETLLEETGVENKKYFSSLFKKRTGLSFRDFRLKAIEQSNL